MRVVILYRRMVSDAISNPIEGRLTSCYVSCCLSGHNDTSNEVEIQAAEHARDLHLISSRRIGVRALISRKRRSMRVEAGLARLERTPKMPGQGRFSGFLKKGEFAIDRGPGISIMANLSGANGAGSGARRKSLLTDAKGSAKKSSSQPVTVAAL
jgi:hypothetical protein